MRYNSFISSPGSESDNLVSLGDVVLADARHDLRFLNLKIGESLLFFLGDPVRNVSSLSFIYRILPIIGERRWAVIFLDFVIRLCVLGFLDLPLDCSAFNQVQVNCIIVRRGAHAMRDSRV